MQKQNIIPTITWRCKYPDGANDRSVDDDATETVTSQWFENQFKYLPLEHLCNQTFYKLRLVVGKQCNPYVVEL